MLVSNNQRGKAVYSYTIGGLERWTGLVDWTTGLTDFQSETRRGAPETL